MRRTVLLGTIVGFVVAAVRTALAISALLPARSTSQPQENPATFVARIVGFVVSDRYASAWPSLYPGHQNVAPRNEYVSCELLSPVGWKLRSAAVVNVKERLRRVPGGTEQTPVTAVTLRLRIANSALHTVQSFSHTFNAVAVGSHWTWILTPSRCRLYRDDTCGKTYSPVTASP